MRHADQHQDGMFLPYMRDVVCSEQSLRELSLMWRMIESSAQMKSGRAPVNPADHGGNTGRLRPRATKAGEMPSIPEMAMEEAA